MPNATERSSFLSGFSLLRFQLVLLTVAIAVRVLRWILHNPTRMISSLFYTFIAGNAAILLILLGRPLFERRPRPWNWMGYIVLLAVAGFAANMIAVVPSYWIFTPPGVSFKSAAFADLPLAMLVTIIVGMLIFFFGESRARLEKSHMEMERQLRRQVQLGLSEKITFQSDLDQAHEIQMHLLPRQTPQLAGFQIACAWQPARSVSGDYFDVLALSEGKLGLCIADVSGKGVAAALLMANLQASVKAFARDDLSPAAMCAELNTVLCDHIAPGRFVTLFYGVLEKGTHILHYESAGHCLPLLVRGDGTIKIPEISSGVLGLFSHWTFSDHELALLSGDVLVLMTDGVLEAENAQEEEFGYQRLIASVGASRGEGAHGIRKRVLEDVTAFCNGQFSDDASLIVVAVD
jgi:phosphoserine phosphatase RsbU/P